MCTPPLREFYRPRRAPQPAHAAGAVPPGVGARRLRGQGAAAEGAGAGAEALRAWYGRADTTVVPHATELGLQAAWGDIVLKGRLDRVDADPGSGRGLVVVDYKTGRRPVTQETADADEALTIYAALVERRLGRPVTRMVLDYVVAGTQVVTERPPEVLPGAWTTCWPPRLRSGPTKVPAAHGPWCAGCDLLKRAYVRQPGL